MNKLLLNLTAIAAFATIGSYGWDNRVTFGDRFLKDVASFTLEYDLLGLNWGHKFFVETGYGYIKSVTRVDNDRNEALKPMLPTSDKNSNAYGDNFISYRPYSPAGAACCVQGINIFAIQPRDTLPQDMAEKFRKLPVIDPKTNKYFHSSSKGTPCEDHTDYSVGLQSDLSKLGDFIYGRSEVDDHVATADEIAANKAQDEVQAKSIPTPPAPAVAAGTTTAATTPVSTTAATTATAPATTAAGAATAPVDTTAAAKTTPTHTATHAKSHGVKSRR